MTIREKLERAIILGDMEEVRSVYSSLFKEPAPNAPKMDGYSKEDVYNILRPVIDAFDRLLDELGASEKIAEPKDAVGVVAIEESEERRVTSTKNPDIEFITGKTEFDDKEGYAEMIAEHARVVAERRKEPRRQAYKADMRKCESCGTSFDYKKDHPMEMTENPRNLCHSCSRRSRN